MHSVTSHFCAVMTKLHQKKPLPESSIYRELAPYLGLGYQLIASAGLLGAIGWWIDNEYNTQPLWLAIGAGLGSVIGLITVIRAVLQSEKSS